MLDNYILHPSDDLPIGISYIGDTVVRKEATCSRLEKLLFMKRLLKHLIKNPDPTIVPVFRFEDLGFYDEAYHYTYDMQRLNPLSHFELKIITKVSDCWRGYGWLPSSNGSEMALEGWTHHPKLMQFLENVAIDNRYTDLHEGNIMRDQDDNFRLIDIEAFYPYFFKKQSRVKVKK